MTDFPPRDRLRTRPLHRRPERTPSAPSPSRCATAGAASSLEGLREEVLPKNILMIGPTGVGKTEISRRLARLASAPFLKVEATKFTEVGYVGRDVEQIIRDLVENAIGMIRSAAQGGRSARRLPPRNACWTRWSATDAGPRPANLPQQAARRRARRQGNRDRGAETGGRRCRSSSFPACPGPMGMINLATCWARPWAAAPSAARQVKESYELLDAKKPTSCWTRTRSRRKPSSGREQTASSSSTRSTRSPPVERRRRRRQPRRCAARPAAADRGHDRVDQSTAPVKTDHHSVHRVWRLPCRQAVRPVAGIAGPPADPRRTAAPDP